MLFSSLVKRLTKRIGVFFLLFSCIFCMGALGKSKRKNYIFINVKIFLVKGWFGPSIILLTYLWFSNEIADAV